MEIVDALQQLIATNPLHWTDDGQPRLDAVKNILGRTVSRAEVKAAVPGFSRTNQTMEEVKPEAKEPLNETASGEYVVKEAVVTERSISDIEKDLEESNKVLAEKRADAEKANAALKNAIAANDKLFEEKSRHSTQATPKMQTNAIQAYLASENKKRFGTDESKKD